MDRQNHRGLRLVLVLDEARRVLSYGQQSLIGLVRESRAKGASVFLISQSPDDFDTVEEDFLSQIGLTACFRSNSRSSKVLKACLGQSVDVAGLADGVAVTRHTWSARRHSDTSVGMRLHKTLAGENRLCQVHRAKAHPWEMPMASSTRLTISARLLGMEAQVIDTPQEIGEAVARFLSTLTPQDCKAMSYGTQRFFVELIIEPAGSNRFATEQGEMIKSAPVRVSANNGIAQGKEGSQLCQTETGKRDLNLQ